MRVSCSYFHLVIFSPVLPRSTGAMAATLSLVSANVSQTISMPEITLHPFHCHVVKYLGVHGIMHRRSAHL